MSPRALVTGGGTGIGRGIALALARRGWSVALAGRRPAPLEAVAGELTAAGSPAAALPTDLAQPGACLELVERARLALGGQLDLLVNNAGVMLPGRLDNHSPADVQQAAQLNLAAPLLLTQAALPDLRARRGSLILVASQAALLPLPYAAVYSATKAGLSSFGAALRYELSESGVRLLVAFPPSTATAMTSTLSAPRWSKRLLADPLRIGEQIVAALESGKSERHWLDLQAPLIWLYPFMPGLVRRLLHSQLAHFQTLMNGAQPEDEA